MAMESTDFIDYYEVMEISPNANSGTIERMFRHLAARYHPDNKETGDRVSFDLVVEANNTLRDPVKRAQYDVRHKAQSELRWRLKAEVNGGGGVERDTDIQNNLLSMLYVKRRQNVGDAGIGNHELERLLDCTPEQLEFQIWYMKEKGWVVKTDNGMLAITVAGVDRVNSERREKATNKLLTDQSRARQPVAA
jgi:curved DNA-binding protein CbpA